MTQAFTRIQPEVTSFPLIRADIEPLHSINRLEAIGSRFADKE
jgi:hypothetical protein